MPGAADPSGETAPEVVSDGPVSPQEWAARIYNGDKATTFTYGIWIMCATASS